MPRLPRPLARLCAASALLLATTAQAQGLLELYHQALDYDAQRQAASAQLQADQARTDQARAGLLPQLGLQAGGQYNWSETSAAGLHSSRSFNSLNAGLVGSHPLYRPAQRLALEQSQRAAEAAGQQLQATEQALIVRLAQAYFDVLAAQDTLSSVRALKAAVAEQLQAAQRNFEVGTATITDSREAQARFDLTSAQELATENELQVRQLALEQLVGRSGLHPHPLAQPIALPPIQPPQVHDWVARSIDTHPALRQARLALDIARLEADKARAAQRPTVDLQASLSQTRYPNGNPGLAGTPRTSSHSNNASIGVMFNLPLYSGGAIPARQRETLALQDKARAELEQLERTITQATRTAFYGVQSGQQQVLALQAAEQSSLTALQANQLGYQVGVRINIDVLNAQSQLHQTRTDLALARYQVLLGQLQLKQAAGLLDSSDVQAIDALLTTPGQPGN